MIELSMLEDLDPRPIAQIVASAPEGDWREIPADQLLLIETDDGTISVALSSFLAPRHVAQVRALSRDGFYEGLSFYRVIEGFVAQGGDDTVMSGTEQKTQPLKAEFEGPLPEGAVFTPFPYKDGYTDEVGYVESLPAGRDGQTGSAWLAHCTGAFAFGRDEQADSASTEFYITLQPQRYLDRNLTVLGRVIHGMGIVQAAARGVVDDNPDTDDFPERLRIVRFRMASDLAEGERPRWRILDDQSASFEELVRAYAARPDPFFFFRPDHVDLCQTPIPVQRISG